MPKIICISGKAQHGKDTVALCLKSILESHNKKPLIIHNADLLKFICKQFLGWDGIKNEEGRHLLQYIGTDVIGRKHPSFWVDFIVDLIRLLPDRWDYVIVPDCRFPSEIEVLKEYFTSVLHVRVIRDDFDSSLSVEQKTHLSEIALDDIEPDCTIRNNSSIGCLALVIKLMIIKENLFFDELSDLVIGDLISENNLEDTN